MSEPSKAKAFELESDDGSRVKLSDLAGDWAVVYFYPRDATPGCTREAQAFTKALPAFKKLGARVVGISKDSAASHCSFREKAKIGFSLLSDPDLTAHKAYGAWGDKVLYGRHFEGTIRSTFLVSPAKTIVRSWRGVKVDGHAEAVLEALREAIGGSKGAPAKKAAPKKKAVGKRKSRDA